MPQYIIPAVCDLADGVRMKRIGRLFAQNDKLAHVFTVKVINNGVTVDLTDLEAKCYFVRPDDATVPVVGTISGSDVIIELTAACYEVPGHFSMIVKLNDTDHSTPIFWGDGTIVRCETDVVVDPARVVPDLAALLAQIETIESAVTAATNAAAAANAAATRTEGMTVHGSSGATAGVEVSTVNDHYHLEFTMEKGDKGDTGNTGATGNGISETEIKYQKSTSGTTIPTGTWYDTPAEANPEKGKYLWTRTVISYTGSADKTVYSVSYLGTDGTGAVDSVNNMTGDIVIPTFSISGDGLVPSPLAAETGYFLRGDGDWVDVYPATTTATLAAASWGSSPIEQTVSVTGVTASNTVIVSPAPSSFSAWGDAGIRCTGQASGTLTFTADAVPTDAVTVNIMIIGGAS